MTKSWGNFIEKISMASIKLEAIPQEALNHILRMQREMKAKKNVRQFSQSLTLLKIVMEHKKLKGY